MTILVDTNVLGRLANPADPQHSVALDAVARMRQRGYTPALVPQVLYEFWVIATRPVDQNGLGMSSDEAARDVAECLRMFDLYRDERAIFDHWQSIVIQQQIVGKRAHDARLVAAMRRHGVEHILTFNEQDFARYEDITVVSPRNVESIAPFS